ncbi:MAG: PDZ domain-containing protein [Lachnospiraceae bacterium]|nr:PDZ domain-containing protein [Lachnospiraceae bacterium]
MSDDRPENIPGQENRPFIRETVIQEESKTSFGKKFLLNILLAVVFGVVAAFTFGLVQRHLPLTPTESDTAPVISFARDETTTAEENTAGSAETSEARPTDPGVPDLSANWIAQIQRMIENRSVGLNDYQKLSRAIGSLKNQVDHSLVILTATRHEESLFQSDYSYESQSFGVIVSRTEEEVLILAPYTSTMAISEASSLSVTFANLFTIGASIKEIDHTTDVMILSVPTANLPESTQNYISVIRLANSNTCFITQPVFAFGAPAGGIIKSFNYGIITYVESGHPMTDNTARLLYTSIPGDASSLGFLVNLDGSLIGWIRPEESGGGTLTAVGISDLEDYIKNLWASKAIGYLGIEGLTLTEEQQEALSLEESGVYVLRCAEDSPALKAGLQRGDILIDFGGTAIRSTDDLRTVLLNYTTEQTATVIVLRKGPGGYRQIVYDVSIERR